MKEPFVGRRMAPEPIETDIQIGLREIVESIYGRATPKLPGLDIGRSYLGTAHDFIFGGDLVDVFHHGDGCTSLALTYARRTGRKLDVSSFQEWPVRPATYCVATGSCAINCRARA